jgi:hypothetical protein
MKKNLLLMAGLIPALFSQAQNITVLDTLSTLYGMNYYAGDTSFTDYDSETGTNANWDYSMLYAADGSTGPNYDTIINRENSTYSSDFLDADYEENFDEGVQSFFSNTPDSVVTYGFVFKESETTYKIRYDVNPLKSLELPTSQGDTYDDYVSGTASSSDLPGQNVDVSGYANVNADGSGTLTLPNGNVYSDVIRIKTVEDIEGTIPPIPIFFPSGGDVTVIRTSYVYYSPSTSKLPIFIYGSIDAEFATIGTVNLKTVWSKDELPEAPADDLSVGSNTLNANISIYPNPASSELNIQSENVDKVSIYSATGQKINEFSTLQNVTISTLSTGMYFIRIQSGKTIWIKRLSKL